MKVKWYGSLVTATLLLTQTSALPVGSQAEPRHGPSDQQPPADHSPSQPMSQPIPGLDWPSTRTLKFSMPPMPKITAVGDWGAPGKKMGHDDHHWDNMDTSSGDWAGSPTVEFSMDPMPKITEFPDWGAPGKMMGKDDHHWDHMDDWK